MQKCLVCSSKKLSTILDLGKALLLINFSQRMKLIVKKKNFTL